MLDDAKIRNLGGVNVRKRSICPQTVDKVCFFFKILWLIEIIDDSLYLVATPVLGVLACVGGV